MVVLNTQESQDFVLVPEDEFYKVMGWMAVFHPCRYGVRPKMGMAGNTIAFMTSNGNYRYPIGIMGQKQFFVHRRAKQLFQEQSKVFNESDFKKHSLFGV
jgi:hypothetical protein